MHSIFSNRPGEPRKPAALTAALTPAARPGSPEGTPAELVAAAEIDRLSPWPTHRIRCFLRSQACSAPAPQLAAKPGVDKPGAGGRPVPPR
jgi:hypothetical protein